MTLERVQPGAAWRPPKAVDTNAIAKCVDEWMRAHELGNASRALPITRTSDLVKVKNLTAAARVLGEVVEVGESLLTQTNRLNLTFEGNTPTATGTRFAILRESAADNRIVSAQIAGIVQARVNVTDESHEYSDVLADSHVLQSGTSGAFHIWWKPDGVGELDCMVMVSGGLSKPLIHFYTQFGGIPARVGTLMGSAVCDKWQVDDTLNLVAVTGTTGSAVTDTVLNKSVVLIPEYTHIIAEADDNGHLIAIWEDCG